MYIVACGMKCAPVNYGPKVLMRLFGTWVLLNLNLIGTVPNLIILTSFLKLHDVHVLSYKPFGNVRDSFRLFTINIFPKLHIFEFQNVIWHAHKYVLDHKIHKPIVDLH
jgi:hypothetical protein